MNSFFMTNLEEALAGDDRDVFIKDLQAAFEQEINCFKAALRRPSTMEEFDQNNASLEVFSNSLSVLEAITK
ncbi:hypothetical protein SG34_032370 [Thalassomonas viridans]|uniref:Uncharacterized protein n=1 Tax=Thalassomonas viridans TaxID=137584 RepID=A0AAE9Z9A7_9GAMM|nr:EscE/YscE/SsaE family type III secretion system needle protein co-chaperone [Thalassomonas viridans]WDE08617.1 hypothetical protein SG34_032370 [Thalassomonas viridans]